MAFLPLALQVWWTIGLMGLNAHLHVEPRRQPQPPFLRRLPTLLIKTGPLTGPTLIKEARVGLEQ